MKSGRTKSCVQGKEVATAAKFVVYWQRVGSHRLSRTAGNLLPSKGSGKKSLIFVKRPVKKS